MSQQSVGVKSGKQNGGDKSEKSFFSTFRAEPALLLQMLSTILVYMVVQDFLTEKVCLVNLGYSEDVCNALQSGSSAGYKEEEIEVQKMLGTMIMARTIMENLFPLFLVILIGAWSDKYGRKLPMLFVVASFILQNVALLICVYFKNGLGGWTVTVVTSLVPALSGNMACFNMAVFSYVAGEAPPEKRTARTGVAHSMLFLGVVVGLGLGGALAKSSLGYGNIFVIGLLMFIGNFIYILLAVKDHKDQHSKPFGEMVLEIFNTQHLKDAFQVVSKPRPGNTRTKLYILLVSHFCCFAPIMGEMTVIFLYGRYKFNWGGGEVGFFMTYRNIIGFLGNFITMGLLTQRLKLSDPLVGICGCVSALLASVYFASVDSDYLMFIGPILAILSGANMVVPRSILSQILPTHELGKVNSFLGCIDSIGPLVAGPVYSMFYTHTFEVFPGGFFLITAALMLPPLAGYFYFLSTAKDDVKKN